MFSLPQKFSENLVIFMFISFVFVSILGMSMSMKMTDGQMSSCPFTIGQTAMCQMGAIEHIAKWHQAFPGISTKTNFLALIAGLLAIVIISLSRPFSQFEKLTRLAARLFAYHKAHFVKIFDPLLIAFSNGILNPKIYDLAGI